MDGKRRKLTPGKTKKKLKLSAPKKKSCPSNHHAICNKEVVIQLERLSDSTVREMTACGPALPPEQVRSSDDDPINFLPKEIILKILGYMTQNELLQIARVCRNWNVLTKSPVLWKKVDVNLYYDGPSQNDIATKLINKLPPCVTHIRLHFMYRTSYTSKLYFEELCVKLQEKCPHLEMLFLKQFLLFDNLQSVIDMCTQFLGKVKVLVFHNCIFSDCTARGQSDDVSKVEVLDISWCLFDHFKKPQFSKMPHLKKLHLRNVVETHSWFKNDVSFLERLEVLTVKSVKTVYKTFPTIRSYGHHLQELYLCGTNLKDSNLNFSGGVFPHLKTICLNICYRLTCDGIVSLIQSCQSLENVYVDEKVAKRYAEHPFVTVNICKSGIVKILSCSNHIEVDYFSE